ncbi:MAG: hypothetical protein RXR52_42065 [Paraburkholderia sp.]|uniref:hypothetical protein n=1 Tax=Burkholderiaceae TaxID=119060 RepID=UPI0010F844AB|nr:hypothetical protein [Burkholderia sp. 4M9327F10]
MDENEQAPAKPTLEERVDRLEKELALAEGQVLAAHAALRALIVASSDPSATAVAVAKSVEKMLALSLNTTLSDELQDGILRGKKAILPTSKDRGA